ncbi:BQ2448_7550 [Microbotryum intermedium]|uniref:BQ2448_7550 protein n=1 Tax=Microbotryum intermedium TaxID=269621 RepID=A0A238FQP9_9BASI|nr:BQ2448_7550 [Microbotryum intermedium]
MSTCISYGASLPDSIPLVNAHTEAWIALLPTLSTYLASRAQRLEREYSTKLSSLLGRLRQVVASESIHRSGPASEPYSGLEKAWSGFLEQEDLKARERFTLGEKLDRGGVVGNATTGGTGMGMGMGMGIGVGRKAEQLGLRLEKGRKKQEAFATKLVSERDQTFSNRDKSRSTYFTACENLETARIKKGSGKSNPDKYEKAYTTALEEMGIAKDRYLLDTQLANEANERLYKVDLPALHDGFQRIEKVALEAFKTDLLDAVQVERTYLKSIEANLDHAQHVVTQIQGDQEQARFVERHQSDRSRGWELPPPLKWEECPIWHDTDDFDLGDSSITFLLNIKMKDEAKLGELGPGIEAKKREVEGLNQLADAYGKDPKLGDAGAVLENYFEATRELTLLQIQQAHLNSELRLLTNALGDDLSTTSLKAHEFKPHSFVTPSTCAVCAHSIWGKGLNCKMCGKNVHHKCELKVPGGCGMKGPLVAGGGDRSRLSMGNASILSLSTASGLERTTSRSESTTTMPTTTTTNAVPPRRTFAPPVSPTTSFNPTTPTTTTSRTTTNCGSASMAYAYTAQTAFELTVQEGDHVEVIEPVDESGWVKVRTRDGREGLVPESYLTMSSETSSSSSVNAPGGGGGEYLTALYAYTAPSKEEHSFEQGERLELTLEVGREAGEGWAEVWKEGRKGLVPLSYVSSAVSDRGENRDGVEEPEWWLTGIAFFSMEA